MNLQGNYEKTWAKYRGLVELAKKGDKQAMKEKQDVRLEARHMEREAARGGVIFRRGAVVIPTETIRGEDGTKTEVQVEVRPKKELQGDYKRALEKALGPKFKEPRLRGGKMISRKQELEERLK